MRLGLTLSLLDYRRVGSSSILPTGYDMYLPDVASYLSQGTLRTANQVDTLTPDALNYAYIPLDSLVTLPVDFFIEWINVDDVAAGLGTWGVLGNTTTTRNYIYYNTLNIVLRVLGGGTESLPINPTNGATTRLVRSGLNWYVYENSILVYTQVADNQAQFAFDNIGARRSDAVVGSGSFKYLNINDTHVYKFTAGIGVIAYDSSGNGNNGTITVVGTGTATWTTGVATPTRILGTEPAIYGRLFDGVDDKITTKALTIDYANTVFTSQFIWDGSANTDTIFESYVNRFTPRIESNVINIVFGTGQSVYNGVDNVPVGVLVDLEIVVFEIDSTHLDVTVTMNGVINHQIKTLIATIAAPQTGVATIGSQVAANRFNGIKLNCSIQTTTVLETFDESNNWGGSATFNGTQAVQSTDGGDVWVSSAVTWGDIITQTALMSWNPYLNSSGGSVIVIDTIATTTGTIELDLIMPLTSDLDSDILYHTTNERVKLFPSIGRVRVEGLGGTTQFTSLGWFDGLRHNLKWICNGVTTEFYFDNSLIGSSVATSLPTITSIWGRALVTDTYIGTIYFFKYNNNTYNEATGWLGGVKNGAAFNSFIIPEDSSNIGFDVINLEIERPRSLTGLNITGQANHHYDFGDGVVRNTKGVLGVEFNNGGDNYAKPNTGLVYSGEFFIELKCYMATSSAYIMGRITTVTNNHWLRLRTTVGTEVVWEVGGTAVVFAMNSTPSGKLVKVWRDATDTCWCTYDDGVSVQGNVTSVSDFSIEVIGIGNTFTGDLMEMAYLNMNDENIYVFDERSGDTILDKVGSKDLTLTDIGNGLPTYVRSDDESTFIEDDGEIIGGSTDIVFIKTELLSQIAPILGDDVYVKSINATTGKVTFNNVAFSGTLTIEGAYFMLAFVTDGYGFGKIYIGDADSLRTTFVIGGRVGDALATATNMFIGNNSATGDSLNGYLESPVHWGRQISEAGLELYRLVTANKL